mmetsp:Transcript_611/g.4190  ORF Transcript_611/g.4190 Transcript_611/m.4190 type:complete len:215 (-) Transcript_611:587-1231(-)
MLDGVFSVLAFFLWDIRRIGFSPNCPRSSSLSSTASRPSTSSMVRLLFRGVAFSVLLRATCACFTGEECSAGPHTLCPHRLEGACAESRSGVACRPSKLARLSLCPLCGSFLSPFFSLGEFESLSLLCTCRVVVLAMKACGSANPILSEDLDALRSAIQLANLSNPDVFPATTHPTLLTSSSSHVPRNLFSLASRLWVPEFCSSSSAMDILACA